MKPCCNAWIEAKKCVIEEMKQFSGRTNRKLLIYKMEYCGTCGTLLPPLSDFEKPKESECSDMRCGYNYLCNNCREKLGFSSKEVKIEPLPNYIWNEKNSNMKKPIFKMWYKINELINAVNKLNKE